MIFTSITFFSLEMVYIFKRSPWLLGQGRDLRVVLRSEG